jgi:hypothetical protein
LRDDHVLAVFVTLMSPRSLLLSNALVRLAYGTAGVGSPRLLAAARFAPFSEDHPELRLFVRGFSAHQIAVAAVQLAALSRRDLARPAALLALTIDAVDVVTAIAEARARGRVDGDTAGGVLFSATGAVTAAAALHGSRGT